MSKNRIYTAINIFGLTIGLCASMLVGSVVLDDLSYDTFWSHKENLYRIITTDTTAGLGGKIPSAYANLGNELKVNFPEVDAASAIYPIARWMRKDKGDENTIQIDAIYPSSRSSGVVPSNKRK